VSRRFCVSGGGACLLKKRVALVSLVLTAELPTAPWRHEPAKMRSCIRLGPRPSKGLVASMQICAPTFKAKKMLPTSDYGTNGKAGGRRRAIYVSRSTNWSIRLANPFWNTPPQRWKCAISSMSLHIMTRNSLVTLLRTDARGCFLNFSICTIFEFLLWKKKSLARLRYASHP
jgi:hypothetical protein